MTTSPDICDILASFRLSLRHFLTQSGSIVDNPCITAQQYQALLAIKTCEGKGMKIKDLGDHLVLKHNGAVQLVDRLAQAGLVERYPSWTDGRSVLARMTEKGEAEFEAATADHLNRLLQSQSLLLEALGYLGKLCTQLTRSESGLRLRSDVGLEEKARISNAS